MTIPLEEIVYVHCHQQGGFTTFSLKTITIIYITVINVCVLYNKNVIENHFVKKSSPLHLL